MILAHATCVEVFGAGILIRGPSGSGKSDLALRLIDRGGRLVADDQVTLEAEEDALFAAPPPTIAGLLEVRGVGILRLPHTPRAPVRLAVDLAGPSDVVERLPEVQSCDVLGVRLARLRLDPFQASACAKIRLAIRFRIMA